ncbi:VanZ family protein [Alteromonas mediterranea]|jgi:VanZ family protein|uniref:VanZ family protein n=1 Tax=Alteromonas mediterranea TaxID=314275 RepID=UPI00241EEEB3|nr:VanZ family protein [Alteromonas mediterranea]
MDKEFARSKCEKIPLENEISISTHIKWRIKLVFLSFLAFVIYGSLVPLQFNGLSFSDALQLFLLLDKSDLALTSTNRSDWFTNFLLMMPPLYTAMLLKSERPLGINSLMYAIATVCLLITVSFLIEFSQLFIKQRISSYRDVYTQSFGMILALVLFYATRRKAHGLLVKLSSKSQLDKWEVYGISLLGILLIYNMMPFDLTLSFTELFKKWASGKISLVPFYNKAVTPLNLILNSIVDTVIWVIISFCFIKSHKYSAPRLLSILLGAAFFMEVAQLSVLSRYSDSTDIVTALLGILIALKLFSAHEQKANVFTTNRILTHVVIILLYYLTLLFFYTYPIELTTKSALSVKWDDFFTVPFLVYWQDAPFNAVTQLLRKILLFIPFGILTQSLIGEIDKKQHKASISPIAPKAKSLKLFIISTVILMIFSLELMQLPIVGKVSSSSDLVLNIIGLIIGRMVFRFHSKSAELKPKEQTGSKQVAQRKNWLIGYFICTCSSFIFCLTTLSLEATPYNIKELFNQYPTIISAFLVSTFITTLIFYPVWFAKKCKARTKLEFKYLVKNVVLLALLVTIISVIIFPNEALHDIVGYPKFSPVPHWLEISYRLFWLVIPFIFLYLYQSSKRLVSGVVDWEFNLNLKLSCLFLFLILPYSFMVVVIQAGTDNLTELLANNGNSVGIISIIIYVYLMLFLSSNYSRLYHRALSLYPVAYAFIIVLSAPLSYWLIQFALVDYILKYDTLFTPLQFLFSPNRESLYSVARTKYIFYGMHYSAFVLFAVCFATQRHYFGEKGQHIID